MFSEYASRFLAQSQSRLSSAGQADGTQHRNSSRVDRFRNPSRPPASRSYLQRQNMPNPYQPSASQISRFPFASRTSAAPAPLFYSATDEFREEDDGEEHEREVADFYALQRSRRQFGASHLTESSDGDEDGIHRSGHSEEAELENEPPGFGTGRGIKSSWTGGKASTRGRMAATQTIPEDHERDKSVGASEASEPSSKGKGRLVDVELASTVRDSIEELDKDEASGLTETGEKYPPAFQQFRRGPPPLRTTLPIPQETDEETLLGGPRPLSPDRESVPPMETISTPDAPLHDPFWSQLFLIGKAALFGTSFLVWIFTEEVKRPIGQDTIFTVLHASFRLLAVYSLISVIVGTLWLALLRSFVRPLVYLIIIAVPTVLFSFFLYPFISSYKGPWHGDSTQDKVMRWFSFVPVVCAIIWVYSVWKARNFLNRSVELLEFTGKVLTAEPPLILVGFATLAAHVLYTWLWILLFTRLFLEGHFNKKTQLFVVNVSTWWLGVGYVLDYLWTLGVISGIQRATTAATVSTWYFHRNTVPAPSSRAIVSASLNHAIETMLGTICMSSFLSLAVRLPLILLPARLARLFSACIYNCIPTSIATLTNPLTLTYAAIHSLSLRTAAHNLASMSFVSPHSPTTTLGPKAAKGGASLVHYRLTKLILHAIRYVVALALGYGGWVATARLVEINGTSPGVKGSLYAYIVGLISGAIGWGVLGSMEGIMGGILDALVICWGSEVGVHGFGEVRYCREAGELFAEKGAAGGGLGGRWV